ncbi:MAG: sulfatase-like hydrolase/transferase [Terriglobales bacterium]
MITLRAMLSGTHSTSPRFTQSLCFFAAYFVLPNLPFWLASGFLNLSRRGYIDIDYVVWGISSLFLPRTFVATGLCLSLFLDVFRTSASFYYFSQRDFLQSSVYLLQLPWHSLALIAIAVGLGLAAWITSIVKLAPAKNKVQDKSTLVAVSVVLILAFVGIDVISGSNRAFPMRDSRPAIKLANAASFTFARVLQEAHSSSSRVAFQPVESATAPLLRELRTPVAGSSSGADEHNIVLVIAESYGLMLDPASAARLTSPYRDTELTRRFSVTLGEVKFHGSTVPAEFRELCGLGVGVTDHPDDLSKCLPTLFQRRGYQTTSFHGFTSHMFDRRTWYPQIGFTRSVFLEQMAQDPGMQHCPGVFTGICDADVARRIGDRLVRHQEKLQFIYWLTLNSHLPVERSAAAARELGCGSANAPVSDVDVCAWTALILKVNSSVAALALRSGLPRTEFIVVGDHAPPFLAQKRRRLFSQDVVPYVRLMPK